ncbi:MAG TPA: hypothetical protein VJ767_08870 [Nitrososphaeraceae archaeon]|nr:hypothetical protein [Nitrososphaeraceae archaeon]
MVSSNIYAQKDLNFQYGNYPKNLAETVEKASEDLISVEMKLLQCVTFVNSASLGQTREMYNQTWSDIESIIKLELSLDLKVSGITVEWNAVDTSNSPIPYAIDLCAKTYEVTGKFIQELEEWT